MTLSKPSDVDAKKPAYVVALEAACRKPSQAGFGSAVFFEYLADGDDLESAAKTYYKYFVSDKWDAWGEEVRMSA